MRIVDRMTFLAMPSGTLFSKYEPCIFGKLCIKGKTISFDDTRPIDFFYVSIADAIDCHDDGDRADKLFAAEAGARLALDLECESRDGCFDGDQLFAVWEDDDLADLIFKLQEIADPTPKGKVIYCGNVYDIGNSRNDMIELYKNGIFERVVRLSDVEEVK